MKLTSTCRHTLSIVLIVKGRISQIPALFTRILTRQRSLISTVQEQGYSIAPKAFSIFPNTSFVFSKLATLQPYVTTFMPSFSHAVFVVSWFEEGRSRSARLAPDFARETAIAAPIPEGMSELWGGEKWEKGKEIWKGTSCCACYDCYFPFIGLCQGF